MIENPGLPLAIAAVAGALAGPVLNAVSLKVQGRSLAGSGRRRTVAFCTAASALSVGALLVRPDGAVQAASGAVMAWQLLVLGVVDAERFWLPDRLTLPLAASGMAAAAATGSPGLVDAGLGAGLGFAGLWAIGALYQRIRGRAGLGGGDPFLLGAGGAWIGWASVPTALIWASAAGLSLVVALMACRREVKADDRLPFGVFLAIGIALAWAFGPLGF